MIWIFKELQCSSNTICAVNKIFSNNKSQPHLHNELECKVEWSAKSSTNQYIKKLLIQPLQAHTFKPLLITLCRSIPYLIIIHKTNQIYNQSNATTSIFFKKISSKNLLSVPLSTPSKSSLLFTRQSTMHMHPLSRESRDKNEGTKRKKILNLAAKKTKSAQLMAQIANEANQFHDSSNMITTPLSPDIVDPTFTTLTFSTKPRIFLWIERWM